MEREPGSMDRAVSPNGRQRRFRMVPVRYLLPNMITLLASPQKVLVRTGRERLVDRADRGPS